MANIGISIYIENATLNQLKEYIDLAAENNVSVIFVGLDSYEELQMKKFRQILLYAQEKELFVFADTTPKVLQELGVTDFTDLEIIDNLGIAGIRLDAAYTGKEESLLSYNKQNLKVILNMSIGKYYIENVLASRPKKKNLLGCHNFYPKKYTGLSWKEFVKRSNPYVERGIKTSAFIQSNDAKTSPAETEDGLVTIESFRNMPIKQQAKLLHFSGVVDSIIISNMFASERDFKELNEINFEIKNLNVKLMPLAREVKNLFIDKVLIVREDISIYCHRIAESRTKKIAIEPQLVITSIKRGDLTIGNDKAGDYQGELEICLMPMENNGKVNVIGHVVEEDLVLLNLICSEDKLMISEKFK